MCMTFSIATITAAMTGTTIIAHLHATAGTTVTGATEIIDMVIVAIVMVGGIR